MKPRFDAYTATTTMAGVDCIRSMLLAHQAAGDEWGDATGYHGFERKEYFKGPDGSEWASMLYGGRQGQRVMVEVKGERSPEIVEHFREVSPEHRCTRVDSCVDLDNGAGTWEMVDGIMLKVKEQFGLYGEIRGDWSQPEKGRTRMLGAATSPNRARAYEKGKQAHLAHLNLPHLCRVEIQIRPRGTARERYSTVTADQAWAASPFTRELAALLLGAKLDPIPSGTVYRESERERALRWMAKQYGGHLIGLRQDLGDWECVGRQIEQYMADARRLDRHATGDK